MIKVYISPCGVIPAARLYEYVDPEGRERYDRVSDKERAYQRLLCRALLIKALDAHGVDYRTAQRVKNDYGKEYLSSGGVYFNCSHTNSAVVVAIGESEVGVDVEDVPDASFLKVAHRRFTRAEYDLLLDSKEKTRDFCVLWTKKESYIKYLGVGFAAPLSSFVCGLSRGGEINGAVQRVFEYKTAFVTVTGGDAELIIINKDFIKDGNDI